jgi:type I restriction enzyme R subunit
LENAISVYTSELVHEAGETVDPEILLQDRLNKGRERLEAAREAIALLCEPVEPPKGELEHIHYFCGNTEIPEQLQEREPQRAALYKATAALVRAFALIADELEAAGYDPGEIADIKQELDHYLKLREVIRKASGETIDLKAYEADMRHLIDTYIEAEEPRKISPFDDMSLLELIVKTGIANAVNSLPEEMKGNREAVAETIENNVRSKIIKDHLNDPAFYGKMSKLLEEIIKARKAKAIEYEEYLKQIADLAKRVEAGQGPDTDPKLDTPGKHALYNNLKTANAQDWMAEDTAHYGEAQDPRLVLALAIDRALKSKRPDGWRGVPARENVVKQALYEVLKDVDEVERIFLIIMQQSDY